MVDVGDEAFDLELTSLVLTFLHQVNKNIIYILLKEPFLKMSSPILIIWVRSGKIRIFLYNIE